MNNHDGQMADAMRRQRAQAVKSSRVDRKGWTDTQWIKDAHDLMHEPDGAVTSLVNGHINAMLRVIAMQEDAIFRIIDALEANDWNQGEGDVTREAE